MRAATRAEIHRRLAAPRPQRKHRDMKAASQKRLQRHRERERLRHVMALLNLMLDAAHRQFPYPPPTMYGIFRERGLI